MITRIAGPAPSENEKRTKRCSPWARPQTIGVIIAGAVTSIVQDHGAQAADVQQPFLTGTARRSASAVAPTPTFIASPRLRRKT